MKKLLPLLIVLLFAGCKKDTESLLTRSWQITAVTTKTSTGDRIPRNISSCDNNKIWTFKDDGSFSTEPSPDCIANGFVDVFNGKWVLTDGKMLNIEAYGGSGAMYFDTEIVEIKKSKLILRTWLTLDGRAVARGNRSNSHVITEFSPR